MHRNKTPERWVAQAVWTALLLGMGAVGCTSPAMEGYQIQAPPEGFLYVREREETHPFLPGRRIVDRGVWYGDIKSDEPQSFIYVTQVAEHLGAEDMRAVWQSRVDWFAQSPYRIFSPVFEVAIDGRSGLAWTEERHDEYGRFRSMTYRAFVPYDSATFFVEYDAGVPEKMNEIHLSAVVASFGLGRTTVHWNVILGAVALVAVATLLFRRRMGPHHTTAYRLPRVPERGTSSSGPETSTPHDTP